MRAYYTCKSCDHDIDVNVTINEEDDLGETCPHCNSLIPDSAHEEVNADAIDRATSWASDAIHE